ncbi:fatty acid desaturase family protein [Sphingomonas oleivorans]|nr:fatty acid desaturase family protein [Sphingomonas oleivorans]
MWTRAAFRLFLASLALNLFWLMAPLDWRVVPAMVAGWYLADLMSGIVHMYMDYRPCRAGVGLDVLYFYEGSRESEEFLRLRDETMRRIGPFERLVFEFKNHHPRPHALGRRTLLRQIGSTVIVASLPFSLLLNMANLLWPVPAWATAGAVTFLLGGTFAQYFHGSLHCERVPGFITLLRKAGLLMTPAAHQLHHDSLQRDFATNNGWSNPLLNAVFRALRRRGMLGDAGLEPS